MEFTSRFATLEDVPRLIGVMDAAISELPTKVFAGQYRRSMTTHTCSCGAELTELTGHKITGNLGVAVYRCMSCDAFTSSLDPPPPAWVSAIARHVAALHADIIHLSYTPRPPG